jgi:hypothetical protein
MQAVVVICGGGSRFGERSDGHGSLAWLVICTRSMDGC